VEFLIDGYNLLHAMGWGPKAGGISLERSRLRLIEWLAAALGAQSADVLVVFDAVHGRGQAETVHRGIRIEFSVGQTADDLIESLIAGFQPPNELTVVSNDHRIQQSARRRGVNSWTCGEYVDWLTTKKPLGSAPPAAQVVEKPELPTAQEIDEWLQRFGSE
jgi:predicted RNA-binding protein with PIN domain